MSCFRREESRIKKAGIEKGRNRKGIGRKRIEREKGRNRIVQE